MRWAVFQTPRGRQVGWAIAVGLLTLTVTIWVVALASAIDWFARSFAIDYGIYMGALDRWQAGNGWYQVVTKFTLEVEGNEKPCCVAEGVGRALPEG